MKRWFKYLLAAITVLAILGVAYEVKGQGCPDDYGCALYYRSDIWPRSDLRAHFVFDPGVQGNAIAPDGDFETFTGAEGGCTDCPTGWDCDCTTVGGDVNGESTYIYQTNTSVRLDTDGDLTSIIFHPADYLANTCYQFDFCYRGGDGTEDLKFAAGNAALTDTYNWAANTWAAFQALSLPDIGTTYTCTTAYLNVGAAAKTGYFFSLYAGTADGTYIYIDDVRWQRLNACSITGSMGNVLSVAGDPQWGHSEVLLPRVGTGPAGNWGMKTDGVDDHLLCPDADCEMDPINWAGGGFFSVGCRVMTDTVVAGLSGIASKWGPAGNRSWSFYRSGVTLSFAVSDDGTNSDSNNVVMFTVGTLHSFIGTFDPSDGVGACENNLYYNAYQTDTDATMTECVPFDSIANFEIGALAGGSFLDGSMLECALWEKELTAIDANKFISPHFPGTSHGDGFWVDTCSQAASHATCSTQVCRQGTPNECQAEGTGVQASFDQATELLENNSWQQITSGGDDNPDFTDWTETETPGDGTASITVYRAEGIHGHAARLKTTGTTSVTRLRSECMTVAPTTAYTAYLKAKKLTDEEVDFAVVYFLYSDGACSSQTAWSYVVTSTDLTEGWEEYLGTFTTAADTNSIRIQFPYYRSTADYLVDVASVKVGSYRKPWVHNPVGTTTYTSRDYRLRNPLADFSEAEQKYGYEDGFCASVWVYTDWAGDDGANHYILSVPGTTGNNNRWYVLKDAGNLLQLTIYDNGGVAFTRYLTATSTNWSVGWHYVEACTANDGATTAGHHYNATNGTWYDWTTTAGVLGAQNGQATDLQVGHFGNANYLDGYTPKIHISPYSATWPMKGWSNGIPPVNGRPY